MDPVAIAERVLSVHASAGCAFSSRNRKLERPRTGATGRAAIHKTVACRAPRLGLDIDRVDRGRVRPRTAGHRRTRNRVEGEDRYDVVIIDVVDMLDNGPAQASTRDSFMNCCAAGCGPAESWSCKGSSFHSWMKRRSPALAPR